ncbi:MAG: hypothetical protein RLZZ558_1423 [Planctomycetota bacterium]|jgi:hypothetical protein
MLWAAVLLVAVPLVGWAALVMFHCAPAPQSLRLMLAAAMPAAVIVAVVRRASVRRTGMVTAGVFALGLVVFWAQAASNDRPWSPDVARLPWAEFHGDLVTVHDIRSCRYRSETDFDVAWRRDTFDLSRLRGVDLFHVFWGSPSIAHTMLSFGFDDGRQLCLSVETRREQGETYDAVKGFFRQYELIYVFGDETDLVKLRTNFRGEQVYLYPLRVPVDQARRVLVDYLKAATELRERPEWYNALTENCTTTLLGQALPVINPDASLDWRMVANGHLHELLYERGRIDTSMPLEQLRRRSLVNDRATAAEDDADFSRRIRQP